MIFSGPNSVKMKLSTYRVPVTFPKVLSVHETKDSCGCYLINNFNKYKELQEAKI